MASSETPSRSEIYYGRVYRIWIDRTAGHGLTPTERERIAREQAELAVKNANTYGYPEGY